MQKKLVMSEATHFDKCLCNEANNIAVFSLKNFYCKFCVWFFAIRFCLYMYKQEDTYKWSYLRYLMLCFWIFCIVVLDSSLVNVKWMWEDNLFTTNAKCATKIYNRNTVICMYYICMYIYEYLGMYVQV